MSKEIIIEAIKVIELIDPLTSVISGNHLLPILKNVKIELKDNVISFTGSNSEITCTNKSNLESDLEIGTCVDFYKFLQILKSVKNEVVKLKFNEKSIVIFHKNGDFRLPLEDINEYPSLDTEQFKGKAKVKAFELKESLRVANKFILNSDLEVSANVSIEILNNKIIVRATKRISLFEEIIKGKGDDFSLMISGPSSAALVNLLNDEKLKIKYNKNIINFKSENKEISLVQPVGDFPIAFFNKIMKMFDTAEKIKIDFKEFLTALKRTSILSNKEYYNAVRLEFIDGDLDVSCENKSFATKSQEIIKCEKKTNKIIGFDSKLLIEILQVFDENTKISFNERDGIGFESKDKRGMLGPVTLKRE